MQAVRAGSMHEVFEHSVEGLFNITLMRKWAHKNRTPVRILTMDVVPFIRQTRVTEEARLFSLTDEEKMEPVLVVLYDDGEHLMIDGSHRALRAEYDGREFLRAYMIPEAFIFRPPAGYHKELNWGDADIVDGEIKKMNAA